MTPRNRSETEVSPPQEPAATPLITAADLDINNFPIVHIKESKLYAIQSHAQNIADQSPGNVKNHQTGKLGEYAVAKPLGVHEDIDFRAYTDGGDGGFDVRYNGATIDVKTASQRYSEPALMIDAYQPLRADYYALASRISKNDIRLIGYVPRKFVADAPVQHNNGDACHYVEQEYLIPFPQSLL